jgi:hypothetical protein
LKENFDRFNFAIHKEKEMNFRRWITALAVLALFTGLASAQVNVGSATVGPLQCNATVAVPPQLRAEGMTELIGDIVLTCTGGSTLTVGNTIPTANITVSLGTNVTSRLLGGGPASEALLLIDEPGSSVGGLGTTLPQTLCSSASFGAGPGGCVLTAPNPNAPYPQNTVQTNVFQGVVSGNQVIFNGIPVLPPVSSGSGRVYRITNVRANVAGLGGGGLAGTTQLLASVSISGSTSLPVSNPVLIAGFIQAGLVTGVNNFGALAQCGGGTSPSSLASASNGGLRFTEGFGTAFKTRVAPLSNLSGQGGGINSTQVVPLQNIPGTIYNSESGFITTALFGNPPAGLADYGTRLKAVFNNVPAGVRIFVTTTNVINGNTQAQPAFTSTTSFAQLVSSETAPDANGTVPLASSTTSVNTGATLLAEIPVVNGTATAVWEVVNTNPSAQETLIFGMYQQFTANPGANSPPPGTATVNLSFAPTPPTAFSASAGSAASSTLTIPRFADLSTAATVFNIALCQTTLLYPFVTNQGGFDTGIAIANTTSDPFSTRTQNGTCTLNWYGGAGSPSAVTTPSIATGTVYSTLASASAANFQGYMIAVCNFQLAHGFAFVSDIGARNLAMGYLALVLPTVVGNRNNINEQLNN